MFPILPLVICGALIDLVIFMHDENFYLKKNYQYSYYICLYMHMHIYKFMKYAYIGCIYEKYYTTLRNIPMVNTFLINERFNIYASNSYFICFFVIGECRVLVGRMYYR